MSTAAPPTRAWKVVLSRLVLDMVIGITFGALFWVLFQALGGNLVEAIKGNVDDAHSLLEGLVILGGFVGGVVGLMHGLAIVEQLRNRNSGDQE
jgi:hypothetical protein